MLSVIYFAAAKLGLSVAAMHQNVSLVWPPTGIALAALLIFGYRVWPGIALGAFLINASTGVGLATAAGIGLGNTLEALSGTYLLRRFAEFRNSLERFQDVLGLVVLSATVSTTVSATVGVTSLCLGGAASWAVYGSLWWQWWLGDTMGALVVAPVLLTWSTWPRIRWQPSRVAEAGAVLVLLVTIGQIVFGGWFKTEISDYSLAFAIFPLVMWAALRFGQPGAATATLLVSGIAIWGAVRDSGPFLGQTLTESFMLSQIFMSVVAVTALVLGAAISQRQRGEEALGRSETRYRELVENATDMVYTHDLAGKFTSLNKAGEEMTGYTRDEALEMNFDQIAAPAYVDLAREMIARQVATEAPFVYELEIVAKGGRRVPLELSTRRMSEGAAPTAVQGIGRDITERRQDKASLEQANLKLTGWVNELEQRTRQITLLNEMGDLLTSCLTPEEAYTVVGQFAQKLFPAESGMLGVLTASKNHVQVVASWGESPLGEDMFEPDECWALRRGRVHLVEAPRSGLLCQHLDPSLPTGYLCLPMMAQGEALGVLHLQGDPSRWSPPDASPEHLWEPQQRLAVSVAEHVALALANLRLRETLRSQSIRDPLTGLFNRRYLEETLKRELHRAERGKRPIGVIMLDIDHFKRFNDTFGHNAGDALLRELGGLLKANLRAGDIVCRYGGEEFVLILPEASLEVARQRAEQLGRKVKCLRVSHRGKDIGSVTLSMGIAGFPDHATTAATLLEAADAALYRAKVEGRDRVIAAK